MKHQNISALEFVLNYFHAWSTKNFEEAASLLSEQISFEMPINAYKSKEAFMQAVQLTASASSAINLISSFENTDEALLLYSFNLAPLGKITIAEHFKIEKGKINFIRHVHDTYPLRQTGFDKANT
jgi:hypothetical protein